jgi:7,8-dihydropterin-6-yl-methyl-4-(beta-D-ribofuranosyl)aminobenzene 5'-phosphate synthase
VKTLVGIVLGLLAAVGAILAVLTLRFRRNQERADEAWNSLQPQPLDLAPVERLAIMPLIDARTANEDLLGEAGVSYFVEAGATRLLFDLGFNSEQASPSPLQQNAETLGVALDEADVVVISHRHLDHVGGMKAQMAHSFVLPTANMGGNGTIVYVPEALRHPAADVRLVEKPQRIAPGVATLGPISRALFVMGLTPEQALAVNVAGKGIVLVVGCGHQGVRRMVERAEALFDEPLYGLVGGLHFPVSGSPAQRFLGTDRPFWQPLTMNDVEEAIHFLKEKGVKWVALSAHDSCEQTLAAFQAAWGPGFEVVTVGRQLEVSGGEL